MTSQHPSPSSGQRAETPAWIVPGQRLIRNGMRLLGALSPVHAARVMDRLWFSAPRTRPRTADQAVLDCGERLHFSVDGRQVTAWAWGDEGPTVILLHGWGGHAAQLQTFVLPLREAGFRVMAFDAPSHGDSAASRHGGQRVTFFQFADALRLIAAGENTLAGIIAHSGGCTAVSLALRDGWTPPAQLVFIAPFVHPAASVDAFARAIGANGRVVAAFSAGVERWLGKPWSYLDISTLEAAHKRHRLLVIHDEEDKEVPLAHARALAASWPKAQLMVTRGLGHRRVLRDPAVVEKALGFLADGATASLAGGTDYLPRDSRSALDRAYEACASR
ncbi:alpha/beta fold hydrolase [Dyella telluris]|uniref:Alpha/beta hydrolase n=1 Tax=Dyella telluris TaxID=2763498 RepID=A0A7G8Q8P8_9GAMM|nr:alpha/beta fold hydrolase [Dyella telluris]QNK03156.1 alpha/beta hydrolase [Dyella telluris]